MEKSHFYTIKNMSNTKISSQSYSDILEEKIKKELIALKKKAQRDLWFLGKR